MNLTKSRQARGSGHPVMYFVLLFTNRVKSCCFGYTESHRTSAFFPLRTPNENHTIHTIHSVTVYPARSPCNQYQNADCLDSRVDSLITSNRCSRLHEHASHAHTIRKDIEMPSAMTAMSSLKREPPGSPKISAQIDSFPSNFSAKSSHEYTAGAVHVQFEP